MIWDSRSSTLRSFLLSKDSATSAWCLTLESCSTMLSFRFERMAYFCFVSDSVAFVSLSSDLSESIVVWRFSITLEVPEVGWWDAMAVCGVRCVGSRVCGGCVYMACAGSICAGRVLTVSLYTYVCRVQGREGDAERGFLRFDETSHKTRPEGSGSEHTHADADTHVDPEAHKRTQGRRDGGTSRAMPPTC